MKFPKRLRGVCKGEMSEVALEKLLRDLSRETISNSTGGMSSGDLIVTRWELNNGLFEIEFSEIALALLEGTQDKRAELLQTLFENINDTVN